MGIVSHKFFRLVWTPRMSLDGLAAPSLLDGCCVHGATRSRSSLSSACSPRPRHVPGREPVVPRDGAFAVPSHLGNPQESAASCTIPPPFGGAPWHTPLSF